LIIKRQILPTQNIDLIVENITLGGLFLARSSRAAWDGAQSAWRVAMPAF
jgi:hypothetical protein